MKKRVFVVNALLVASLAGCGHNAESSTPTAASEHSSVSVATYYGVVITASDHATLHVDKTSAKAGETITVTYEVEDGYVLDSVKMNGTALTEEDGRFTFVMPEGQAVLTYSVHQNAFAITLPENLPEGISITVSEEGNVVVGTGVDVFVSNRLTDKKVKEVAMNGTVLEGKRTNVENTTVYHFEMPSDNVSITASVVDVYHVTVSSDVSSAFGLDGNLDAEAGETVEFVPAVFTGYWAKDFIADCSDVIILPVDGKENHYSFVMPAHDVAIKATIGQVAYKVFYENRYVYKITMDPETEKPAYDIGDTVRFKVEATGSDAEVRGCKANGVDLGDPDVDGYFTFTVKPMENVIEPIMHYNYKTLDVTSTDHYDFELTTKDRFTEQEEGVVNTVLSSQTVYINAVEKAGIPRNNFVPNKDGIKIFAGADAASAVDITSRVTISNEGVSRYGFTTSFDYAYYRVEPAEIESDFKYAAIVGTYDTGMRGYYDGNYKANVDLFGTFNYSYSRSSFSASPSYSSTNFALTVDANDPLHYTGLASGSSTEKDFFFNGSNALLYVDSNLRQGSYFYAKGFNGNAVTSSTDPVVSYFYMVKNGSGIAKQFYHLQDNDGNVATAYYDFETKHMEWNVTSELLKGTDGFTKGDVIAIKDSAGVILDTYEVKTTSSYSDGYQYEVGAVTLDGFEGTYAPATANDGTDSMELTGYGIVRMGGAEYTYEMKDGFLAITINQVVQYFVLDKTTMTYTASQGPTDGFEGTYTYGDVSVIIDGHGAAKIGNADYTYTIDHGRLVLTDGTTTMTLTVDKENMILAEYVPSENPYLGNSYEGSSVDGDYGEYENFILVTFTTDSEAEVKLHYTTDGTYDTLYREATAEYLIADGVITIQVPNRQNTGFVPLVLTENEDENLVVGGGSTGFYFDTGFSVPSGTVLIKK